MKKRFAVAVTIPLAVWLLFPWPALAQDYPLPFPREGATMVRETDYVVVWNVKRERGKPTRMYELPLDQISVTLREGAVKVTRPDGSLSMEQERVGSVQFESKGTIRSEEGLSDTPSRLIVFQLKAVVPPPRAPTTEGIPGQFPREGAVKLFENDRVTVWDNTWPLGRRGALHTHYTLVVGVFLQGGTLRSFSAEGRPADRDNIREVGDLVLGSSPRLTPPYRSPHQEESLEGPPRAIFIEFK